MREPTIYSIVEKGDDGNYTKWALLYQDILNYSVYVNEGLFKERQLANWLLARNQYNINFYKDPFTKKTNDSNRVENILPGVKDKLDDLVKLRLFESGTAPAEKGSGGVRVCKITTHGRLLILIIESFIPDKREKAYEQAYNILQSILNIEPRASHEIFHSALYRKYMETGLFGEFVMERLRGLLESYSEVKTIGDLLYSSLMFFHTDDANKGKLYLDLWAEAFDEMTPYVQEHLLFNMKLEIERRMMQEARVPSVYEKHRKERINNYNELIMEGYCKNCNLGYPVSISLKKYIERTNFLPNQPIVDECPHCKKRSRQVPTL